MEGDAAADASYPAGRRWDSHSRASGPGALLKRSALPEVNKRLGNPHRKALASIGQPPGALQSLQALAPARSPATAPRCCVPIVLRQWATVDWE